MSQIEKTESHSLPIFAGTLGKSKPRQNDNSTFSKAFEDEERRQASENSAVGQARSGKDQDTQKASENGRSLSKRDAERLGPGIGSLGSSDTAKMDELTPAQVGEAGEFALVTATTGLKGENAITDGGAAERIPEIELAEFKPKVAFGQGAHVEPDGEPVEPALAETPIAPVDAVNVTAEPNSKAEFLSARVTSEAQEQSNLQSSAPALDPVSDGAEDKPKTELGGTRILQTGREGKDPLEARPATEGPVTAKTVNREFEPKVTNSVAQKAALVAEPSDKQAVDLEAQVFSDRPERAVSATYETNKSTTIVSQPTASISTTLPVMMPSSALEQAAAQVGEVEPLVGEQLIAKERAVSQHSTQLSTLQPGSSTARLVLGQFTAGLQKLDDGVIEIRLNPAELGRLTIQISESVAGSIANVSADRPDVLELLRRNENLIQSEFEKAGFANMDFEFSDREADSETGERGSSRDAKLPPLEATASFVPDEAVSQPGIHTDLDIRL